MNKEELIKNLAKEFGISSIDVSKFVNNVINALEKAFINDKDVNISEFGKFKILYRKNKDGLREKSISFSPVKKLARDVNHDFNELSAITLRLLQNTGKNGNDESDYDDDDGIDSDELFEDYFSDDSQTSFNNKLSEKESINYKNMKLHSEGRGDLIEDRDTEDSIINNTIDSIMESKLRQFEESLGESELKKELLKEKGISENTGEDIDADLDSGAEKLRDDVNSEEEIKFTIPDSLIKLHEDITSGQSKSEQENSEIKGKLSYFDEYTENIKLNKDSSEKTQYEEQAEKEIKESIDSEISFQKDNFSDEESTGDITENDASNEYTELGNDIDKNELHDIIAERTKILSEINNIINKDSDSDVKPETADEVKEIEKTPSEIMDAVSTAQIVPEEKLPIMPGEVKQIHDEILDDSSEENIKLADTIEGADEVKQDAGFIKKGKDEPASYDDVFENKSEQETPQEKSIEKPQVIGTVQEDIVIEETIQEKIEDNKIIESKIETRIEEKIEISPEPVPESQTILTPEEKAFRDYRERTRRRQEMYESKAKSSKVIMFWIFGIVFLSVLILSILYSSGVFNNSGNTDPVNTPGNNTSENKTTTPPASNESANENTGDKNNAEENNTANIPPAGEEKIAGKEGNFVIMQTSGGFYIQTGSYKEKSVAEKRVSIYTKAGMTSFVTEADLGEKGTFYRVRIGAFKTLEEAKSEAAKLN